MKHELMHLMRQNNPDLLVEYIDSLNRDKFSLVSIIDSLAPLLVMESNLRFGSFHLIKMSLFLRNLSLRGALSRETEIALAKVVVQHLYYLEWIQVSAAPFSHVPDPVTEPVDKMLAEIRKGNAHNAFFYASIALKSEKKNLLNALLLNGTTSIADTLGHSISCFFPVLEEIVDMDHPSTGTSLFSYIMYLCRLRKKAVSDIQPESMLNFDRSSLLRQAASGDSIVDIHHMITYYIYMAWEKTTWTREGSLPWHIFLKWISNKQIDNDRLHCAQQTDSLNAACEYEQWLLYFTKKDKAKIIAVTFSLLDKSWTQSCDWLFRAYAQYYTPDWDPHYFTSLYAALEMYRDNTLDRDGRKMAIIQAIGYFLDNI